MSDELLLNIMRANTLSNEQRPAAPNVFRPYYMRHLGATLSVSSLGAPGATPTSLEFPVVETPQTDPLLRGTEATHKRH